MYSGSCLKKLNLVFYFKIMGFLKLFLLVVPISLSAQQIKIVGALEYGAEIKNYILTCEFRNDSETDTLYFPLPKSTIEDDNVNGFNYLYELKSYPSEAIKEASFPPDQFTQVRKLTIDDIVICPPKTVVTVEIDTKNIMLFTFFDQEIKLKKLYLRYDPTLYVVDKETNLDKDLIHIQFYNEVIQSKIFNLR